MCKGLIGKKLGMTGLFLPDGSQVPVTVLEVGPCIVTQVKTKAIDGYDALQLGFDAKSSGKAESGKKKSGEPKRPRVSKPMAGHLKKSGDGSYYILREFGVDDPDQYEPGKDLTTELFSIGEHVDVAGISKGRGFAGVMKRHGFHGGRETHGGMCHRRPGSIGCSATPSKVVKGKKLPGQYGNARATVRNLEIVDIRPEQNLVLVKGAIPGARSGYVEIKKLKFTK